MDQPAGPSKSELGQMPQMMDFNPNMMMGFNANMPNFSGGPQPKSPGPANARSPFIKPNQANQAKTPMKSAKNAKVSSSLLKRNNDIPSNSTPTNKKPKLSQKPNHMSTPIQETPKRINQRIQVCLVFFLQTLSCEIIIYKGYPIF